jgi:hypothetical protein
MICALILLFLVPGYICEIQDIQESKVSSLIWNLIEEWNQKDSGVHDVVIVNSNREISLNIPPENPVIFIQGPTDEQFQVSRPVSFGVIFLDHLDLVRIFHVI